MSPRPYNLSRRQEATEQTRARILTAARELLAADNGISAFSIDAVARQAGVARMTVYYQFDSRSGLLEALMDDLATRGQMERLALAFGRPELVDALDEFIAAFGHFWSGDRLTMRRLRSLAALDVEFEQAVRARDDRRRQGLRVIVQRVGEKEPSLTPAAVEEAIDLLFTLSSFETFDTLAGPARTPEDVTPVVQRLAKAALGIAGIAGIAAVAPD
jgi:AcrR family transcriptional regulator